MLNLKFIYEIFDGCYSCFGFCDLFPRENVEIIWKLSVSSVTNVILLQGLNGELTWVTSDHVAGPAGGQLSVRVGQQVEIMDRLADPSNPDMLMVRLVSDHHQESGYVPISCLKLSKNFNNDQGKMDVSLQSIKCRIMVFLIRPCVGTQ